MTEDSGDETSGGFRMNVTLTARRACSGAVITLVLMLAGCSHTAPPSPPDRSLPPSVVDAPPSVVELPPPDHRGATVTIEGVARWSPRLPGCVQLQTDAGQVFQLTGSAVSTDLGKIRQGASALQRRVRVTGYVPEVGASVCGAVRAFLVEQGNIMDR